MAARFKSILAWASNSVLDSMELEIELTDSVWAAIWAVNLATRSSWRASLELLFSSASACLFWRDSKISLTVVWTSATGRSLFIDKKFKTVWPNLEVSISARTVLVSTLACLLLPAEAQTINAMKQRVATDLIIFFEDEEGKMCFLIYYKRAIL